MTTYFTASEEIVNRCLDGVGLSGPKRAAVIAAVSKGLRIDTVKTGEIPLRDWFAGMALSGCDLSMWGIEGKGGLAENCYRVADAMLAQREKQP